LAQDHLAQCYVVGCPFIRAHTWSVGQSMDVSSADLAFTSPLGGASSSSQATPSWLLRRGGPGRGHAAESTSPILRKASGGFSELLEGPAESTTPPSSWVTRGALALAAGVAASRWPGCRRRRLAASKSSKSSIVRRATASPTVLPQVDRATTKKFRKDLMKSDQYFKFGKSQMKQATEDLIRANGSDVIRQLRASGLRQTVGDITFVLAGSYGFCWGVERAVAMACEARNFFPEKSIFVSNEIIHNPIVNERLTDLGMKFIPKDAQGSKDFSEVQTGDVVVLPAFGASVDEMAFLKDRGAQIVDTTCPWVSKVWNSVEKTKEKGFTSIIHGVFDHEETVATKSFAGKYIVVKTMADAEYLATYVLGGSDIDRSAFMLKFAGKMSEGFDPDVDLDSVGVANQTTMLEGETELIGKLFERVMIKKHGPQSIDAHFVSFNTICDATQERQGALYEMLNTSYEPPVSLLCEALEAEQGGIKLRSGSRQRLSSKAMEEATKGAVVSATSGTPAEKLDLLLVVGGFNSSNTTHLAEISEEEGVSAYHVDSALRIGGAPDAQGRLRNVIEHKPLSTPFSQAMVEQGLEMKEGFLPEGPLIIGVTSGASTPDSELGECLERLLLVRGQPPLQLA